MAEISDLLTNDANNIARWPEGTQTVPQLNDSGRALEGILARWYKDLNGATATTGSSTQYTFISNRTGITQYSEFGAAIVRFHVACGDDPTFRVGALAYKPLKRQGGDAIKTADIGVNQMGLVVYNASGDYLECVGVSESVAATGWAAATGNATRTTFATSTVTLPVLAEHVKALIDDLTAKGLIGP